MAEKWERWMLAEIEIMKKFYPNMPRAELLQLLPGRSWKAILGAADRYSFARSRSIPRGKKEQKALHAKMSTIRGKRTQQPFAGKHHSADAKRAIGVANLHSAGHSIADIALRNGIAEKEVKKILGERGTKRPERPHTLFKRRWTLR